MSSMSVAISSEANQESTFLGWPIPNAHTYESLKARTKTVRALYERDVKDIAKLFRKHKRGGTSNDCADLFEGITRTNLLVTKLLTDLKSKESNYETRWVKTIITIDQTFDPVYTYVYKGGMVLGAGVTGTSLFFNPSPKTDSSPLGWIGYGLMILAFSLGWTKDNAKKFKEEQKEFHELFLQNEQMKLELEASLYIFNHSQEIFDDAIKSRTDPFERATSLAVSLAAKNALYLTETFTEKGLPFPEHLRKATNPTAIKRVILLRGPSQKLLAELPASPTQAISSSSPPVTPASPGTF